MLNDNVVGENDRMRCANNNSAARQQLDLQQLTADDWPLWWTMRLQALREAPYAYGSRLADWQGKGDLEERWRARLSSVPFNLIAVLNGGPVGMASATEPDPNGTVELISLWVAPSDRGCGVGDALVNAVIQWAEKQQALRLCLDVTKSNEHAIALYFRHGFVDAGELTPANPGDAPERRFLRNLALSPDR